MLLSTHWYRSEQLPEPMSPFGRARCQNRLLREIDSYRYSSRSFATDDPGRQTARPISDSATPALAASAVTSRAHIRQRFKWAEKPAAPVLAPNRAAIRRSQAVTASGRRKYRIFAAALGPRCLRLVSGGVTADQTLVVMGATGGVGGYATQMAVARGAHAIATVRGDVEGARRLGAKNSSIPPPAT
jgi:hypothetical protein